MPPSDHSDSSHDSSSDSSGSSYSDSSFDHNDSSFDHGNSDYGGRNSASPFMRKLQGILFWVVLVIAVSGSLLKDNNIREKLVNLPQVISNVFNGKSGDSGAQEASPNNKSEIFVEEIGRTCKWDSESESYYDKTSDCYFWMNDTIDTPQWQYWYEDISSDYGDYGWMEYDFEESIWYIEVAEGDWDPLSNGYDTTELWHFSTSS